jgi:Fe-S cluster assembly scaffold protein SufB
MSRYNPASTLSKLRAQLDAMAPDQAGRKTLEKAAEQAQQHAELAEQLRARIQEANANVLNAEEALQAATSARQAILQQVVPEAFRDLMYQVADDGEEHVLVYEDGMELRTEDRLYVRINADDWPEAYRWLMENDHGEMVRATSTLTWAPGRMAAVQELEEFFARIAPQYEVHVSFGADTPRPLQDAFKEFLATIADAPRMVIERKVHPETLRAFVRKQRRAGATLPDVFKIHAPQEAVLTTTTEERKERPDF